MRPLLCLLYFNFGTAFFRLDYDSTSSMDRHRPRYPAQKYRPSSGTTRVVTASDNSRSPTPTTTSGVHHRVVGPGSYVRTGYQPGDSPSAVARRSLGNSPAREGGSSGLSYVDENVDLRESLNRNKVHRRNRDRYGIPNPYPTTNSGGSNSAGGGNYSSSNNKHCLLYTSPSPRDRQKSRMPSSA